MLGGRFFRPHFTTQAASGRCQFACESDVQYDHVQKKWKRLPRPDKGDGMNRRTWSIVGVMVVAALLAVTGVGQDVDEAELPFGFGVSSCVAFFPDLTGVNAFLSENSLPPFGEILWGASGYGRGGTIGGGSFGGGGWAAMASSVAGDRTADLVCAGGGFDVGWALGGDERSVLTVGTVWGGGATVLDMTFAMPNALGQAPQAIIIEPTGRTLGRLSAFAQPYISLQAQLLSWMGIELRIGYLLPLFGFDFGDAVGIPAPSLDLGGPIVNLGVTFGGIGSGEKRGEAAAPQFGTTVLPEGASLRIEGSVGDMVVLSYEPRGIQTEPGRIVDWTAIPGCSQREAQESGVAVEVEEGSDEVTLRTVGDKRVDLEVRVPNGTDLFLHNGAGVVMVSDHQAQEIVVETGVGEIVLERVEALVVVVAHGVGSVRMVDVDAIGLTTSLGVGEIILDVDAGVSATITASTGLGDVEFRGFPGSVSAWTARGFVSEAGKLVLGAGEASYDLNAGVGSILVESQEPWGT